MRWLLIKDLQILRRSPLLVGLLVVYPIAIALMIGFALSSPPSKPTVAFYNEVPKDKGTISLGSQKLNVASYASDLLQLRAADQGPLPGRGGRRGARRPGAGGGDHPGRTAPADPEPDHPGRGRTRRCSSTSTARIPIERQFVDQAISSRINQVEQDVSKQVLRVAVTDLQQVLNGGSVEILGQTVRLLGLRNARTIVQGTLGSLPSSSPLRPALGQVISFADLAIQGLGFAKPVLGTIGTPLTVNETQLDGRTTPTDAYAAAIAVIVSLMFVTMLLAAGMLALERTENAYPRLVRGLVTPGRLLSEKVILAAGCATVVTLSDGRVRVAVRAPRLGPLRAVGGGAGPGQRRLRRAGGGDRRHRARGERGVADGLPRLAADRVRRPGPAPAPSRAR